MHAADAVWNRALDRPEPPGEREGDAALRTLLSFHGAAMNGGPLHAWEVVGPEGTAAAVAGYRYFFLADAASAVEWLRAAVVAVDLGDIDAAEAVELQADDRTTAPCRTTRCS